MSKTTAEAQEELFATDTSDDMDGTTVAEGYILDFIEDVENHVLRAWSEFNGFAS